MAAQLTAEQFAVTRRKGTEPAFTGKYWNHKKVASNCVLRLALARRRSEWEPAGQASVPVAPAYREGHDAATSSCGWSPGVRRLGHVFNDGPPPTGLRYCTSAQLLAQRWPISALVDPMVP